MNTGNSITFSSQYNSGEIENGYTSRLLPEEPPYCECARTGMRSLSWLFWVPGLSENRDSLLDRNNLNLGHEHIIFDQSRDNIGFGPEGLFSEKVDQLNYHMDKECYDGSQMRKAIEKVGPQSGFNLIRNNCQDFVAKIRDAYFSIFSQLQR